MRLILLILIAIAIFSQTTTATAKEISYFDMELPVMTGVKNISRNKNDQNYTVSLSYEIVIQRTETVYNFYNEFFKKQGWENFIEGYAISGKWSGYSATINPEGRAEFNYYSMWQPKDDPVFGSLNLNLYDYKNGLFYAKVQVILSPELNDDSYIEFSKLLEEPKNIFILQKAIGRDPFQLKGMMPDIISKEYDDELIIKEYRKLINSRNQQYKDFGEQYVHNTKPIDGKFKRHFSKELNSAPANDKAIDKDEQEDPLLKWRRLQEEREKEQSNLCECQK